MKNITQLYTAVYQEMQKIQQMSAEQNRHLQGADSQRKAEKDRILQKMQQERQDLNDQLVRAESFRAAAKDHTRQRKPGYAAQEPDFSRLFVLHLSIDDDAVEDDAAAELWARSNGAVTYLQNRLRQLDAEQTLQLAQADQSAQRAQAQLEQDLKKAYEALFHMPELHQLADEIKDQTGEYFISQSEVYEMPAPAATSTMLKFGMIHRPFPMDAPYMPQMQKLLGSYYDAKTQTVRMPFGFRTDRGVKLLLEYPGSMQERVQKILIGFLFNVMRHYKPIPSRVYYLDTLTYNPDHLGVMRHFTGTDNMICFPRTEKETDAALAALMTSNGMDAQNRENRILIVRDFPGNFSYEAQEKILNICSNAAYYQVTVLFTGEQEKVKKRSDEEKSALNGALHLFAKDDYFHIEQQDETLYFSWFAAPQKIAENTIEDFRQAFLPVKLGNSYPERVVLTPLASVQKGNKHLRVPIGVDTSDQLTYLDMNELNFATYLMGASGSGKSTLLHTIITGLIQNYHPDDVELWLADFKMGEFAQYMNPRPPHVRYVLMDDSRELVYDFLDLLSHELTRRKRFFSTHSEYKKVEDVPTSYRMPLIVVIVDEFSLMSQAIKDEESYRLLLQNLLSGGRAPGFRFIFASQDYTNGITGLTEMAKDQIQSRLAMKNTLPEIRETLNLSSGNLTDQLKTWTETLPPYTVIGASTGEHGMEFHRSQVLYFPKQPGLDTYAVQRQMIEQIRDQIRPVPAAQYDPENLFTYVEKHPVDADGNTLKCFTPEMFHKATEEFARLHPDELFAGDLMVAVGEPRRLDRSYAFPVAEENRENLILMSGADRICSVSILNSLLQSFLLQGGNVQIWSYRRNQLYVMYRKNELENCAVYTEPREIGHAIEELKEKIARKEQGKDLIVLMGMDHIREDFEFMEPEDEPDSDQTSAPETENDAVIDEIYVALGDRFEEIQEEGIAQNKTDAEIDQEIEDCITQYMEEHGIQPRGEAPDEPEESVEPEPVRQTLLPPDYDADLSYIVGNGPHCGYHFLLCAVSYPELRKTGFNLDWFRHKISFRISTEDASMLFGNRLAATLPEHVGLYESDQKRYTFRPFLHWGIGWDGWEMDARGNAVKVESEV